MKKIRVPLIDLVLDNIQKPVVVEVITTKELIKPTDVDTSNYVGERPTREERR